MSNRCTLSPLHGVRSFRYTYQRLLTRLLDFGHREVNERTGAEIAALPPTSFFLDLSGGELPMCGVRKTFPRTAAAEVAWFLSGSRDVGFIKQYAPIWDKFVEDDGVTVAGAYGYRWRAHFARDQITDAIAALRANPSDRRIYVSAWDPAADGLGRPSKNVPCPVGFTLSILNGRLNSSLHIRSSDVFVGLPYDVMGHALLMAAVAASLDVNLGTMQVSLAHPHLYGVHREMAELALSHDAADDVPLMPTWSVERITAELHEYVAEVKSLAFDQPQFHCRPEIVQ